MSSGKEADIRYAFIKELETLMLEGSLIEDLDRIYMPMANLISEGLNTAAKTQIIGINGAQGAGKTTFCNLLEVVLETGYGMNVVLLGIDDLYFKRSEREKLAQQIHPLLITRGVPGTHDVALGERVLNKLCNAGPKDVTRIPRFNKAIDDQYPESEWEKFTGRPDVILFDGWFMGAVEQPESELKTPVNKLEELEDPDGVWRTYVNEQLKTVYKPFFEHLDLLVMLKIPSFDKVYEWRALQESKLRISNQGQKNLRIMDNNELERFIAHYERLTRHILNEMPDRADMLFKVNDNHRIYI
jgi:D-glycerate 3-kinase